MLECARTGPQTRRAAGESDPEQRDETHTSHPRLDRRRRQWLHSTHDHRRVAAGLHVFMTFAWYGHLKHRSAPLVAAILVSWLIALGEYCFQVPANRIGYGQFTVYQ